MSKRPPAKEVSAISGQGLGDLLYKLGNPSRQAALLQVPADDADRREFLEAARKLFAHKTDEHARRFLKMPIDTPRAVRELEKALVREIAEIRQEGDAATDQVQYHRLQLALLIDDALILRDELTLGKWTRNILKEADRVTSAKRSQDGSKRDKGPDITKQRWAASHIERLRLKKPDISVTKIAAALYATARKEKPGCWSNAKNLRAWLYRNKSLLEKEKMAR